MVILVSPDERGRINLTGIARSGSYEVSTGEQGVITLTPLAVVQRREFEAVAPVISPEEAFGITGSLAFADALDVNRESRRRNVPNPVVTTVGELHALIWGDAA